MAELDAKRQAKQLAQEGRAAARCAEKAGDGSRRQDRRSSSSRSTSRRRRARPPPSRLKRRHRRLRSPSNRARHSKRLKRYRTIRPNKKSTPRQRIRRRNPCGGINTRGAPCANRNGADTIPASRTRAAAPIMTKRRAAAMERRAAVCSSPTSGRKAHGIKTSGDNPSPIDRARPSRNGLPPA